MCYKGLILGETVELHRAEKQKEVVEQEEVYRLQE